MEGEAWIGWGTEPFEVGVVGRVGLLMTKGRVPDWLGLREVGYGCRDMAVLGRL